MWIARLNHLSGSKNGQKFAICAKLAILGDYRHMRLRESDGRCRRQPGQVLTEAAVTIFRRVIRLLFFHKAKHRNPLRACIEPTFVDLRTKFPCRGD